MLVIPCVTLLFMHHFCESLLHLHLFILQALPHHFLTFLSVLAKFDERREARYLEIKCKMSSWVGEREIHSVILLGKAVPMVLLCYWAPEIFCWLHTLCCSGNYLGILK